MSADGRNHGALRASGRAASWLVLFLALLTASLAFAAARCELASLESLGTGASSGFFFEPHRGTESPERETQTTRYFLLGKGLEGGMMWRAQPKQSGGRSRLEKKYTDAWKADEDRKRLDALSRAEKTGGRFGFELPRVQRNGDELIYDRDVQGRDLHWLLSQSGLSEAIKGQLRADYLSRLARADDFLKRNFNIVTSHTWQPGQFPYSDGTRNELPVISVTIQDPETRDLLQIHLKPDNVIVHSEARNPSQLRMTLVDPY